MNTPVHVLSLADERRVETRTSVTDIFRSNAGDCFDLKTLWASQISPDPSHARAGLYRLSTDALCTGVGRVGWKLSSVSDELEF